MNALNADLHCHSTASDGTLAPAAVVRRAHGRAVQHPHLALGGGARRAVVQAGQLVAGARRRAEQGVQDGGGHQDGNGAQTNGAEGVGGRRGGSQDRGAKGRSQRRSASWKAPTSTTVMAR